MTQGDITILNIIKDKKKYKVITSENEYNLSEDTIIKHMIFKDKVFSNQDFKDILKSETLNTLFNKSIKYLSYQYRSIDEMIKYLKEKEATFDQVEIVIEKLIQLGYLNDERYASETLDYVIRNHKGPKILENKLIIKGIDENIINNILSKFDYYIEKTLIEEIILKFINKNKNLPIRKQKLNIYHKLISDGFNQELINEIINKQEFIDDSDDNLLKDIEKLVRKYTNLSDYERRTKIINNLMSKGYEYSKIVELLNKDE